MNLASWIILAILAFIVALAIRSVFFKKNQSCCGSTPNDSQDAVNSSSPQDDACSADALRPSCAGCPSCSSCTSARNCLQPTIKLLENND